MTKMRNDELQHHGILGQKWGVRRYQNTDGSYTPEGRERYGIGEKEETFIEGRRKPSIAKIQRNTERLQKQLYNQSSANELTRLSNEYSKISMNSEKMFKEYVENPEVQSRYAAIASLANAFARDQDKTLGEVATGIYIDVCEDGDQQEVNSASVYAKDNNIFNDNFINEKQKNEINKDISKEVRKAIFRTNKLFKNSSEKQLRKVAKDIKETLRNEKILNSKTSAVSTKAADWTKKVKDSDLARAKQIVFMLEKNGSLFDTIKERRLIDKIYKMNLDDTSLKDISDAQWQSIAEAI